MISENSGAFVFHHLFIFRAAFHQAKKLEKLHLKSQSRQLEKAQSAVLRQLLAAGTQIWAPITQNATNAGAPCEIRKLKGNVPVIRYLKSEREPTSEEMTDGSRWSQVQASQGKENKVFTTWKS